ncbi:MAG: membrane protein [Rhodospirillaceae bacterium BRH_c57]|nr:MAG: membrane protein [Rhodospirillaceae bacterium BRH_c57]
MTTALLADPQFLALFAGVLVLTGAVAGVLAGLLGVGGGIVIVPVLFNLFPFLGIDEAVRMHLAVGTSLATIIPTSIMSARAHDRRGSIDRDLLRSWGPAVFVGVVAGTVLGAGARGEILTAIFAVVALLVAANMALRSESMTLAASLPIGWVRHVLGLVVGGFSVVMGIGGGTLSVPILTAFSYPIRRAVGTAAALGFVIAVPGTIGFIIAGLDVPDRPPGSLGYVNLIGFALIVPATMLTAPLGARIAHAISPSLLRKAFAVFLLATSLRMFASVI